MACDVLVTVGMPAASPNPDSELSQADLDQLRAMLERERAALRPFVASPETRIGTGEQTDSGDIAERTMAQESALRLSHHDARLLRDVEDALRRIDDGTYGVSEESGEPIPVERLRAIPWARRTVEEEERVQRRRG